MVFLRAGGLERKLRIFADGGDGDAELVDAGAGEFWAAGRRLAGFGRVEDAELVRRTDIRKAEL